MKRSVAYGAAAVAWALMLVVLLHVSGMLTSPIIAR